MKTSFKKLLFRGPSSGYAAVHAWIRRGFPKTGRCEHCHEEKKTEWANRSGEYRRERDDWVELCHSCHARMDAANQTHGPRRPRQPRPHRPHRCGWCGVVGHNRRTCMGWKAHLRRTLSSNS